MLNQALSLALWLLPLQTPGATATAGNTPSPAKRPVAYPMEAELLHTTDLTTARFGDHVFLKLARKWVGPECTLAPGTVLTGDVAAVESWVPATRHTRATLDFHFACSTGAAPHPLTWIALLAPDDPDLAGLHGNPVETQSFRSSSFGEGDYTRSSGTNAATQNHTDLSGRQNPSLPLFTGDAPDRTTQRPTVVQTGQVWHIPGLTLEVPKDLPAPSTLVTGKKKLRILSGSVFVLSLGDTVQAARQSPTPPPPAPVQKSAPPMPPQITACPPATCHVDSTAPTPTPTEQLIPLDRKFFRVTHSRQVESLNRSAAIAFLGNDQVLVASYSHALVQRKTPDPRHQPREIRAALIDAKTSKLLSTVEWLVDDTHQFLWPLPGGRAIVHQGDALVWIGPNLQEEAKLPLTEPLAFLRISPDGHHYLVATLHELHTPQQHTDLADPSPGGPEEQLTERLFDANLHELSREEESSRAMLPSLTNAGRLVLRHARNADFYYREFAWDGTTRDFAHVHSTCIPQAESTPADLLLLIGCDSNSLNKWLHVVRPDGTLVLKGVLSPQALTPMVVSGGNATSFALALPISGDVYSDSTLLDTANILSEHLHIYSARDGGTLVNVKLATPNPSMQPAALAPAQDRLAYVDGTTLKILPIPLTESASIPAP